MDVQRVGVPPFVTGDLGGIGGRIKERAEDFEVEEIPAYAPSGSGAFLFLWVEKRSLGAEYFQRQVARRLGIGPGEVGSAGLKDRHAVTRQMISVPASAENRLAALDGDGIRLLGTHRHTHKLRPGHLRGNRFRVLIRDPDDPTGSAWEPIVDRLRQTGLANFYGSQRFGIDGETTRLGWALVAGTPTAEERGKLRKPFLRKLALSALQSALFNAYLANRLRDGLLHTVLGGDVMGKWPAGGMFVSQDTPTDQARFDRREIVSLGPIFGRKTFPAADMAAAREQALLQEFGLEAKSFAGFGKLALGTRRQNLIYIDDLSAEREAEGLRLGFTLPAGSYATVLLREVMKKEADAEEAP